MHIAEDVVQTLKNEGARFLRKNNMGLYVEVDDKQARAKASQALRENAPEIRHQLAVTRRLARTAQNNTARPLRRSAQRTKRQRVAKTEKKTPQKARSHPAPVMEKKGGKAPCPPPNYPDVNSSTGSVEFLQPCFPSIGNGRYKRQQTFSSEATVVPESLPPSPHPTRWIDPSTYLGEEEGGDPSNNIFHMDDTLVDRDFHKLSAHNNTNDTGGSPLLLTGASIHQYESRDDGMIPNSVCFPSLEQQPPLGQQQALPPPQCDTFMPTSFPRLRTISDEDTTQDIAGSAPACLDDENSIPWLDYISSTSLFDPRDDLQTYDGM